MLIWLVEDLFFVGPRAYFRALLSLLSFLFFSSVGVQAQAVPEGLWLLEGLADIVEFNANFELAPACLGDGEGLTIDCFDG